MNPGVSAKRGSKWEPSGKLTGFNAIRVDMVEFDLFSPWDVESEKSDLRVTKNRLVPHSIRGSPVLPEERLFRVVEAAQENGVFHCWTPFEKRTERHVWKFVCGCSINRIDVQT